MYLTFLHSFSNLLCPRANRSCCSLLSLLYFKRAKGAICSCFAFKKSNSERITPVALYKKKIVSYSLLSLMKKELRERFALFNERIALLLTKNERFAGKNR